LGIRFSNKQCAIIKAVSKYKLMKNKSKISSKKIITIVEEIIKNAPLKKTIRGKEKTILVSKLKKKFST
jgi:hypothetical protein